MKTKQLKKFALNSSRLNKKERTKDNFPILKSKYNISEKKKVNRSSSAIFLKRSYNNTVTNFKNKTYNKVEESELNMILYRLKNYYNKMLLVNNNDNKIIKELDKIANLKETKIEKLINYKNFELPYEKISIGNIDEINYTKKEIEDKVWKLFNKKQQMDYLILNEKQYLKKLEYMYDNEKNKYISIKKETNELEFNLKNIKNNIKSLEKNINGYNKNHNSFKELNENLDNNIDLALKIIEHQREKNNELNEKINKKEKKLDYLESKIKYQKVDNKSSFEKYKQTKYNDIKIAYEKDKDKKERDNYLIDVINCLYIIKKYFIESKNNNEKDFGNNKEIINFINNKNVLNIGDNTEKNFSNIEDLKSKFNQINVRKKEIFDFNSELTSKNNLNLIKINYLSEKEIIFRNKRNVLNEKVKKIINSSLFKIKIILF